jgi:preprotein translocase subunit SecG
MTLWAASWLPSILNFLLLSAEIFLMGLILIQKGRGGGLAGAFGGPGGSSAFGSRAGDTFTKVTIYTAIIWLLLIMFVIKTLPASSRLAGQAPTVEERQGG